MIYQSLYNDILTVIRQDDRPISVRYLKLHEILVEACYEGVKGTRQNYGSLFAQVDHLCRHHNIPAADIAEIQRMRYNTNQAHSTHRDSSFAKDTTSVDGTSTHDDLLYDCRALALFISAISSTAIPGHILSRVPHTRRPNPTTLHTTDRCIRCVATTHCQPLEDGHHTFDVRTDTDGHTLHVIISDDEADYLRLLIQPGTVLSLLDSKTDEQGHILPAFVVTEPDLLIDISAVARCFTDYGHHPLSYLVNQLTPPASSQAILLGNYSDALLDATIRSHRDDATADLWQSTLRRHFSAEAMAYVACPQFSAADFKTQCQHQARNIIQIAREINNIHTQRRASLHLPDDAANYILEPSFVSPALGLQGRVDLMTDDLLLLVEQKSGKNFNLERHIRGPHGEYHKEAHYVQLLLYYAVLRQNFGVSASKVDIRLMYSRYPLPDGLLIVGYYRQLIAQALRMRNRIACSILHFSREGFTPSLLRHLTPATLCQTGADTTFCQRYILPQQRSLLDPLQMLSPVEEAYFCRFTTFVHREYAIQMTGACEGTTHGAADAWNMPLDHKQAHGEIILCQPVTAACDHKAAATESAPCGTSVISEILASPYPSGDDEVASASTHQVTLRRSDDREVDFRSGDSVYLYRYAVGTTPLVTHALLFKGAIVSLTATTVTVYLHDPQPMSRLMASDQWLWAIEHTGTSAPSSRLRSLYSLVTCTDLCQRQLILGTALPTHDPEDRLTTAYHPSYDSILRDAFAARGYYLLVGPPGTGKTSMALRFMVLEQLRRNQGTNSAILLSSYTNRAIDEICGMLTEADVPYLRIGNTFSCAKPFRHRLARQLFAEAGNLTAIRQLISQTPVIVATTSTLLVHQEILTLRTFSLTIVDEASQILEPDIVGLLSRVGKFILIGDIKQLPAVVQQAESDSAVTDTILHNIHLTNCRYSLFERLITVIRSASPDIARHIIGTLNRQGRMHPDIARWVNTTFYREEAIQPVPLPHQQEAGSLYGHQTGSDTLGVTLDSSRTIFLDVTPAEGEADAKTNLAEARLAAQVTHRIYIAMQHCWDQHKTLGIIVPYRNQISLIRKEIELLLGSDIASEICIDTVERYQGSQRDVILYSFTVSRRHQLEFLTSNTIVINDECGNPYAVDRKLNVAITRARKQLIMIGNRDLLSDVQLYKLMIQECTCLSQSDIHE